MLAAVTLVPFVAASALFTLNVQGQAASAPTVLDQSRRLNTPGAGFVEAIANKTLLDIRDSQPQAVRGTAVIIPVLDANSASRVGRFGWKSQHVSLESFSADAHLNEMGVTSRCFPAKTRPARAMSPSTTRWPTLKMTVTT